MNTIIQTIAQAVSKKNLPVVVAIDGRCGAGKTTLANALSKEFGWALVHLDDFFPTLEQRNEKRLQTPGSNLDHERFLKEVLMPIRAEADMICYRPFNCHTMAFDDAIEIKRTPVMVIEGSYAHHPLFISYYDIKVFLDIKPDRQLIRIYLRNGKKKLQDFKEKWIPFEEKYFDAFAIRQNCDLYFLSSDDEDFLTHKT